MRILGYLKKVLIPEISPGIPSKIYVEVPSENQPDISFQILPGVSSTIPSGVLRGIEITQRIHSYFYPRDPFVFTSGVYSENCQDITSELLGVLRISAEVSAGILSRFFFLILLQKFFVVFLYELLLEFSPKCFLKFF